MSLAVLALAAALVSVANAFNQAEFKSCADVAFCGRLRGAVHEGGYTVQPASVIADQSGVRAKLLDSATGGALQLDISAYEGSLRIQVDEPGAQRFHVADVLSAGLAAVQLEGLATTEAGVTFSLGADTVTLAYAPFRLSVATAGTEVLAFNSRSMFAFEHVRPKREGDPAGWWEETFKTHRDSKPKVCKHSCSLMGSNVCWGQQARARGTVHLKTLRDQCCELKHSS